MIKNILLLALFSAMLGMIVSIIRGHAHRRMISIWILRTVKSHGGSMICHDLFLQSDQTVFITTSGKEQKLFVSWKSVKEVLDELKGFERLDFAESANGSRIQITRAGERFVKSTK